MANFTWKNKLAKNDKNKLTRDHVINVEIINDLTEAMKEKAILKSIKIWYQAKLRNEQIVDAKDNPDRIFDVYPAGKVFSMKASELVPTKTTKTLAEKVESDAKGMTKAEKVALIAKLMAEDDIELDDITEEEEETEEEME